MAKDLCTECNGLKDKRAKMCCSCRMKYNHPRLNTGVGWRLENSGYITGCFNGKYISKHRYVMGKFLGRKLKSHEHVHHINGNKEDNRIENLELLNNKDHHKKHMTSEVAKDMSKKGHKKRWGYESDL